MQEPFVESVRAEALRALNSGMLGVMAATYRVAEGNLRALAEGRLDTLPPEELEHIARVWRVGAWDANGSPVPHGDTL